MGYDFSELCFNCGNQKLGWVEFCLSIVIQTELAFLLYHVCWGLHELLNSTSPFEGAFKTDFWSWSFQIRLFSLWEGV